MISDALYNKVTDIMSVVHNLDGNYDLPEVLQVIDSMRHLTEDDLHKMGDLPPVEDMVDLEVD